MAEEIVFTAKGSLASLAAPVTLAAAGFLERAHLEEWVITNPGILGPDVMVVTSEFGSFINSKGTKDADRLDVLGLASDGRLVLAELKRGPAPHTVEMQALNYAARVSAFTVDQLTAVHRRFLTRRENKKFDQDQARDRLIAHAPELTDDTVQQVPRLVLVATDFGLDVTTTAVFLARKLDVDIHLVRLAAYKTPGGETIVTVSKTFPPPDFDAILLFPNAELEQAKKLEKTREKNTVARLLAADAITAGTTITFHGSVEMAKATQQKVLAWIKEEPGRGRATWQPNPSAPLVWEEDGKAYTPTGLVRLMADRVGVKLDAIPGPRFWRIDGKTLPQLANEAEQSGL